MTARPYPTAGRYLRERREMAGVPVDAAAFLLGRLLHLVPERVADLLRDAETGTRLLDATELMLVRLAFDFRPASYRALAAQDAALPPPASGDRNA